MKRYLLTGAAGAVGSELARLLPRDGESWRLVDLRPPPEIPGTEILRGDLTDPAFARAACAGVDAIVHLAGRPKEGPWEGLIGPNMIVAATLWEAARLEGVGRIIYGSSNHVTGMYPVTLHLDGTEPARPDSRYGVTKAFGEAVASYYADKFGIRAFVIRIGSFQTAPRNERELSSWISPRDLASLVRIGLGADYHYETVLGISGNTRAWASNARAIALGYTPQDNAEDYVTALPPDGLRRPSEAWEALQGGGSAAKEFAGDLDRLRRRGHEG